MRKQFFMNFLSHYYFERHNSNCYYVLGTVLPDLLKNADKHITLHPEKLQHTDPSVNSIITGWQKHLAVDKIFHSSSFFIDHSHLLKKQLLPAIEGSPVKPFFLGHVGIELLLDNLLITTGKITADGFYDQLSHCNEEPIIAFLLFSGLKDPSVFLKFFKKFKSDRYLHTYADTAQVAYALKRICMRIWADPFSPQHEQAIEAAISTYRLELYNNFMDVFNQITARLD